MITALLGSVVASAQVCADMAEVESRLASYARERPAFSAELRTSLEECLDGRPGLRETLVDRGRRCLAADPWDRDAVRIVGLLGDPSDAPLILAVGPTEDTDWADALARIGGELATDALRWSACTRGAFDGLRRVGLPPFDALPAPELEPLAWFAGPLQVERMEPAEVVREKLADRDPRVTASWAYFLGSSTDPEARSLWREVVRDGSDRLAVEAMRGLGMLGSLADPRDVALLEELATRPWTQRGRYARVLLFAAAAGEWPVPERWVAFARDDLARGNGGSVFLVDLIERVDGQDAVARFGVMADEAGWPRPHVPGPSQLERLVALPLPTFPPPATPVSDAGAVRQQALAWIERDPAAGIYLLGFVARRNDLDRLSALVGDLRHGKEAALALARVRTPTAVDRLITASRGAFWGWGEHARRALGTTRTERGWRQALISWQGRATLYQSRTGTACAMNVIVAEATGHSSSIPGCPGWEPMTRTIAPDPYRDAMTPWKVTRDWPGIAGDPVAADALAVAVAGAGWPRGLLPAELEARVAAVPPAPPPPAAMITAAEAVAAKDHAALRRLATTPGRAAEVLAAVDAIEDRGAREGLLGFALAVLPEPEGGERVRALLASPDAATTWVGLRALADRPRPFDTDALARLCEASDSLGEQELVLRALAATDADDDRDRCMLAAIGTAAGRDLGTCARLVAELAPGAAAYRALWYRERDAPPDARWAIDAALVRAGLRAPAPRD